MKHLLSFAIGTCLLALPALGLSCSVTTGYKIASENWVASSGSRPKKPNIRIARIERGELTANMRPCGYIAVLELIVDDESNGLIAGYYISVDGLAPSGLYVPDTLLIPRERDDGSKAFWFSWPELLWDSGLTKEPEIQFTFQIWQVSKSGAKSEPLKILVKHPASQPANNALHQPLDPARLALPLQAVCIKCW